MEGDCEMASKGEEKKRKPIVVVLVGAPGSGKSTFCDSVIRASTRPWVRICQDTIGNGKAGTKAECVVIAATALKDGKNVFIDRCNLEKEQRNDFVKLGLSHAAEVHAIVLDLPANLCIFRSVKRTGHEGNLQGGKAAAVVNRMLQKKELPKLSEGFSRIIFCESETDVEAALTTYSNLGPLETLPSGCFGQKNRDSKLQLSIMKFLKKVDTQKVDAHCKENATNQLSKEKCHRNEKREIESSLSCFADTKVEDGEGERVPTLAFPSLSTADFQFDIEMASEIIVEKVEEFLKSIDKVRLVLVDLSHGSKILSLVKTKAAKKNIDPNKFLTFVGNITCLSSEGGLQCNVIANAANWRLKPGGGGVNAAIFSAAGPTLDIATKERARSLSPGTTIIVPLPSTSPLFINEGITHVIHVLGPNMNPQRPNCLKNDYVQGCKVLRDAYSSLFESFASIVKSHKKLSMGRSEIHVNPSSNGDLKVKREDASAFETKKKSRGFYDELDKEVANCTPVSDNSSSRKTSQTTWGSWAQALYHIAMNPEKHEKEVLDILDDVVVLNDLYPKSERHLLVLARAEGLDRLADVCKVHLELLRTMHSMGLKWVEKLITENQSLVFRLGYHSAASMRQLHLHVISQDFDSKHLKNKKHWNSFNSPFFRDSVDVIEEVDKRGEVTLKDNDCFLSMELRCHRCRSAHPNIPRLKSHISHCRAPFPATLLQNNRLVCAASKI